MTRSGGTILHRTSAAVLWVFGGMLLLAIVANVWIAVSLGQTRERGREHAEVAARANVERLRNSLHDMIADGELSDAEVGALDTSESRIRAVDRGPDRIVVTALVDGSSSALMFGGATVQRCAVYEIPLPITAEGVVRQRDQDTCP